MQEKSILEGIVHRLKRKLEVSTFPWETGSKDKYLGWIRRVDLLGKIALTNDSTSQEHLRSNVKSVAKGERDALPLTFAEISKLKLPAIKKIVSGYLKKIQI